MGIVGRDGDDDPVCVFVSVGCDWVAAVVASWDMDATDILLLLDEGDGEDDGVLVVVVVVESVEVEEIFE